MPQRDLLIRNPSGLHARPAATFVKAATGFAAAIGSPTWTVIRARRPSAKSILGVMGIGAVAGHRIRLSAEGADADEALRELAALVEGWERPWTRASRRERAPAGRGGRRRGGGGAAVAPRAGEGGGRRPRAGRGARRGRSELEQLATQLRAAGNPTRRRSWARRP